MIALCDKGRAVVIIYLDINFALDMIFYSMYVSKLVHFGLDRWMGRWVKNWLVC